MTPHDLHVLGGTRAMDDRINETKPEPEPKWGWPHLAVLGSVFFVLGVIAYNVAMR